MNAHSVNSITASKLTEIKSFYLPVISHNAIGSVNRQWTPSVTNIKPC